MHRVVKAAVAAFCLVYVFVVSEPAYAFDGLIRAEGPVSLGGSNVCVVSALIEGAGTAYVELENPSTGLIDSPTIAGWQSFGVISGAPRGLRASLRIALMWALPSKLLL